MVLNFAAHDLFSRHRNSFGRGWSSTPLLLASTGDAAGTMPADTAADPFSDIVLSPFSGVILDPGAAEAPHATE